MKKILSYVAIIGTAAFAGNMINIGLSYGALWKALEPQKFMETFKVDFPLLLMPTAATLLPAFVSTVVLFFLSKKGALERTYWLYALIGLLSINVFTALYFLPLNLDFVDQVIPLRNVSEKLNSWLVFHWVRIAVAISAAVFAVKAYISHKINPIRTIDWPT